MASLVKRSLLVLLYLISMIRLSSGQELKQKANSILFHGIIVDSDTKKPLTGSQIHVNKSFLSVSDNEGKFAFYVNRLDTVKFSMLGYKSAIFLISDTLRGNEFITGVYLNTDTLSLGEIVIVPRFRNLKSDLLNARTISDPQVANARHNLELAAYQGKITQNQLGDPATNFEYLRQKQFAEAYTKGQIPSDRILGLSPLMVIPAVYLLMNGLPDKPSPLQPSLSDYEINLIFKKYLDTYGKK